MSIDLQLQFVMVWQQFHTIVVAVEISNVGKERETVTRIVIANQACFVAKTTAVNLHRATGIHRLTVVQAQVSDTG